MRNPKKASLLLALLAPLAVVASLVAAAPGAASPINPQPPGVIDPPALTGLQVGDTLTASAGTWGGGTPITYIYIWMRSSSTGFAAIPGAGGLSYTVTEADVGHSLMFQVKATNEDGSAIASSAKTAIVTGATASGTQTLPDGSVSVLADNVTLPDRLVVKTVTSSPTTIAPGGTVTLSVLVADRAGHPVRNALVQVVPFPYGSVLRPAEATTGADGTAAIKLTATSRLKVGTKLVGLYVQARKSGDDVLAGVTGTRLVNLTVKS